MNETTTRLARVLEDNYPAIYHMERLMSHMWDEHFNKDEDVFEKDERAKRMYTHSYGFIMSQIHMLSEELFRVRVDIELALGLENECTMARIKNDKKSWSHMDKREEDVA